MRPLWSDLLSVHFDRRSLFRPNASSSSLELNGGPSSRVIGAATYHSILKSQSQSRNAPIMKTDTVPEGSSNLLGALIFFSYIAAALALTATVIYDIYTAYHGRRTHPDTQDLHLGLSKSALPLRLTLAFLSFTTLSYHMLSFLIDSYTAWSLATDRPLPTSILGSQSLLGISGDRTPLEIWTWATSSTLFQNFAEAICRPSGHYWWTQKALVFSFVWNVYMAEKGK